MRSQREGLKFVEEAGFMETDASAEIRLALIHVSDVVLIHVSDAAQDSPC